MLISEQRNFIFIHVYKNAGTSITVALLPYAGSRWKRIAGRFLNKFDIKAGVGFQNFPNHIKASQMVDAIGRQTFDSYFSFAFVRNPWDWQVSLYNFMLKKNTHHQHDLVRKFENFDQYIRWRCQEEVRLQKDFIYSNEGELLVDFVGRYENLEADFQKICSRIGIEASLPRLNVSNTRPYQQFYTSETEELVRRTFEADIVTFGYNF